MSENVLDQGKRDFGNSQFTLDHISILKVYFPHSIRYRFIRLCLTTKIKLPAVLLSGARYLGEGEETSNALFNREIEAVSRILSQVN